MRAPLFVVGMPRSGTTLLSAMLSAHSQVVITPETHFYTRCDGGEAVSTEEMWRRLRQQPGLHDMELTDAELRRVRERAEADDRPRPAALLDALGTTYAERHGADIWGEKTPDHLAHVPTILRDFPTAAVVGIVRDPRDVCLSLRDMPWNRDALPESAWTWRRYAQATERYRSTFPEHFREVRYEDLLDQPEAVLRSLTDWMGLPFEPGMLAFHQSGAAPADTDREPWKQKTRRPLDPSNKEKWRTRMPAAERAVVDLVAGRMLEAKGYARPLLSRDAGFAWDLVRVLLRAAATVGRRWWNRWRMPAAAEDESHAPVWTRLRDARAGQEERNGDESA